MPSPEPPTIPLVFVGNTPPHWSQIPPRRRRRLIGVLSELVRARYRLGQLDRRSGTSGTREDAHERRDG